MTQHQQLQKKINGIIQPDAEKLLVQGCGLVLEDAYYEIDENLIFYHNKKAFLFGASYKLSEVEILGPKLNLEAVLMGLGKLNRVPREIDIIKGTLWFKEYFTSQFLEWNLTLPPDQQPIETQKALFEIFNV